MTFLALKNLVEHTLGSAPDSLLSKGYIVNEAIRYLYDFHPWSWRRKIAALAATAASPLIPLPSDFESLLALEFPSGSTNSVQVTEPTELLTLIRQNQTYSDRLYATLLTGDTGNSYAMQLRVYPVPTASNASYLNAAYLCGFTRFIENDASTADDAKLAPIPAAFAGVLGTLVRATAKGEDADDPQNPYWALAANQLEALVAKDAQLTPPTVHTMYTTQRAMMQGAASDAELVPSGTVSFDE